MTSLEDALIPSTPPGVKTSVFEGPLDLLLFLIRKNEIDIYDIPIEKITRQYLDILFAMEKISLDIAGEFFVMASILIQIKSRTLLPRAVPVNEGSDEEPIDPRWELVQQLIEYKQIKEAADELESIIREGESLPLRMVSNEELDDRPSHMKKTDVDKLWSCFNSLVLQFEQRVISGTIHLDPVTIADRMTHVLDSLEKKRSFLFNELFEETEGITVFIVTFLAVLELARLNKLQVLQKDNYGEIYCEAA